MNEKLFKQALNNLADEAIPSNYDPCPDIRKRIEAQLDTGTQRGKRKILQPRLVSAGFAALLVIIAGTILLFTPPGQAFAQGIFHFFTLAENDILPLPTGQPAEPPPPTRTTAPTDIVALQQVTPVESALDAQSYPTAMPAPTAVEANAPIWNLSIEEAKQLAGFELHVPASLPPGYRLDNVIFDPRTNEVSQIYGFHPYSAGEQFILHQRPSAPDDVVGQSAAVEQMAIGGVSVEFVEGSWFGEAGADVETWHTNSIHHTFRWQEGNFYFSLEILFDDSDTWSPAYWTKDGMLAMVEIAMDVRTEFPEQININNLTSIGQAEEAASFDLLVPSVLPEGFVFSRAVFEPQAGQVSLFYQPQDGSRDSSGVRLLIVEKQGRGQFTGTWDGYPEGAVEEVLVGSSQAVLARGALADGVYEPDTNLSLVWNTADRSIKMIYSTRADYPVRLDQEKMIAIAESME